jgi:hypothetical protein
MQQLPPKPVHSTAPEPRPPTVIPHLPPPKIAQAQPPSPAPPPLPFQRHSRDHVHVCAKPVSRRLPPRSLGPSRACAKVASQPGRSIPIPSLDSALASLQPLVQAYHPLHHALHNRLRQPKGSKALHHGSAAPTSRLSTQTLAPPSHSHSRAVSVTYRSRSDGCHPISLTRAPRTGYFWA